MLLPLLGADVYRPTRDIDLLGIDIPDLSTTREHCAEVAALAVDPDGLDFDPASVVVEPIRAVTAYGGAQVALSCSLAGAVIPVRIDIGIGDAVTPAPVEASYPTLLDMPAPVLRMYPVETVIAEKFEAMVRFGQANSRIKDYYDLWTIARTHTLSGETVAEAIAQTFARRGTPLPHAVPSGLRGDFLGAARNRGPWRLLTAHSPPPVSLQQAGELLAAFLLPPAAATLKDIAFASTWRPGGSWEPTVEP